MPRIMFCKVFSESEWHDRLKREIERVSIMARFIPPTAPTHFPPNPPS